MSAILKTVGIALLLYFVYRVWDIVMVMFVALIFSALIDPFATWFQRRRIPRGLAVLLIYLVVFGLVGLAVVVLSPVIINDVPQLFESLGTLWADSQEHQLVQQIVGNMQALQQTFVDIGLWQETVRGATSGGGGSIFSTVSGFFGGIFSLILVLVITYYMVVQDEPLKKIIRSLAPDEYVPYITQLIGKMRDKLGAWMRGQLILSLVVGLLVFVGLGLLHVKYAAALALIAALLEFVPYLGPTLAAVPALIFAFVQGGPVLFFFVLILYIVIQQLENHLLIPKIMQRTVGLNPVVSIVAILVGWKLAGVLGALLAIPVATALSVLLKDVLAKKRAH